MPASTSLPHWDRLLAVVAHPDDESFGLGGVLSAFVASGCQVDVLCFTRGEASTLHGVAGDLSQIRAQELRSAADALGAGAVDLRDHPDGRLSDVPLDTLVAQVAEAAGPRGVDGVVVFAPDGITGHPDHQRATQAALAYADSHATPALAWTLTAEIAAVLATESGAPFGGRAPELIDITVTVDRTAQREAIGCHSSQALPGAILWRRLDLQGDEEHLFWLLPPAPTRR